MILGLGMDIVEVETIAGAMRRDGDCAAGWFTEREITALGERAKLPKVLAGRIAAKEAVVKSLGTGFAGDVAWQDVEVLTVPDGAPAVELSGGAALAADRKGITHVMVTITHTERVAAACAIAIAGQGLESARGYIPR
jgi:holo-[acyl-carrier protein] synthase